MRVDNTRYGVRYGRWEDTGERFGICTIDGNPVALEPEDLPADALAYYAEKKGFVLVSEQLFMATLKEAQRTRLRAETLGKRRRRWLSR